MATVTGQKTRSFHHEAAFYNDPEEFLAATVPFLEAGLERNEPMLVAVNREKINALTGELNGEAERVRFVDMERIGRNPARIIPVWRDFVQENCALDKPARGIGEPVWPGRTEAELVECGHHETLLNLAFADAPGWSLLCPYDASALSGEVIEAARSHHPHLGENGEHTESPSYLPPDDAPDTLAGELPPPSNQPRELAFIGSASLRLLRTFIGECADGFDLSEQRKVDLVLAVNEAATNSVRHAGGHGRIKVWAEDDDLVCDVVDEGRIDEPLVGRRRPTADEPAGRGLWLTNQLCDLVQIRSGAEGTTVRLHMYADVEPI